jgi:hypothetical protein
MRSAGIRLIATACAASIAALMAPVASAAPACSGDACESLTLSDDGCVWKNASDKPVKFTLFNTTETLFATVLPPGEVFRQTSKAACVTPSPESPRYQASFAAVRKMPDAPDFTLKTTPAPGAVAQPAPRPVIPRAKPDPAETVVAAAEPAAAVTPAVPAAAPVVAVKPVPKAKPEQPPVLVAVAPPPPVATLQMPTQAEIDAGASPCGDACAEILFKQVDDCLWVQSQNPKPIMFQASVDGRMILIPLEGASYEKSSGTPASDSAAHHARQRDPFQSSSAGIPVYRARIGDKGVCVKDKAQITQFVAVFRK